MGLITPLKHKSPSDIYILLKFADTRIASSSRDKTVRLWNVGTGKLLGEPLEGHTGAVFLVSISPDGTRIASGSEDKTVRLWDVGTGQLLVHPITLRLWDAVIGQPLGEPLERHTGAVISVSFSPDSTRIASGSEDKTVRLWDTATRQPLGEPLEGHTGAVVSVSFSPDGTRITSGSEEKTVRLWNAVNVKPCSEPIEPESSAFSLHRSATRTTQESRIMQTNTWNNRFISSSSLEHALPNPSDLLEPASHHDSNSTPFLLQGDGWDTQRISAA